MSLTKPQKKALAAIYRASMIEHENNGDMAGYNRARKKWLKMKE